MHQKVYEVIGNPHGFMVHNVGHLEKQILIIRN